MKCETYNIHGLVLRPMVISDLELVRAMRNRPDMRRWMTTDHEISKDEMVAWFNSLPATYQYWMVESGGKIVGQVNLKQIDKETADPGYIFWDEDFVSEGGAARAALTLFIVAFDKLKYARLRGITEISNRKAMRLAKGLGFHELEVVNIAGKEFKVLSQSADEFKATMRQYEGVFE